MKKLIHNYKKIKCSWFMVALLAGCLMAWASAASAATHVYAEGAYNDTSLAVYVYADISEDAPLVSQCVKVTYDPEKLAVRWARKNCQVWYFGQGTPEYGYMDPEDTGNAVIIIGGKLDTNAPKAGVSGERVLLGTIKFTRLDSESPGASPEDYFDVALHLGKDNAGKFANFVDINGNVQDDDEGLFTGVIIRQRGDANGDGSVTPADMISVRNYFYGDILPFCEPAADCNDDAPDPSNCKNNASACNNDDPACNEALFPKVTPADMICIRNIFYSAN